MNVDGNPNAATARKSSRRVLLVEPNQQSRELLIPSLQAAGLEVVSEENFGRFRVEDGFDLVLVDVERFTLYSDRFARIQNDSGFCPIIVLTHVGQLRQRIEALTMGADDYIIKPCPLDLMMDRIRTCMERKRLESESVVVVADLQIDPRHQVAYRGAEEILLTPREFELLYYLARNEGEIVSRRQIIENVYQNLDVGGSNVIDVYIRYLRKKIELPGTSKLLHTFRRKGYMLGERLKDHHKNEGGDRRSNTTSNLT